MNVISAGFFTFSSSDGGSAQDTLQSVFPQAPVPTSIAMITTPMADTTALWMTVALTDTDANDGLFSSIVDIGVSNDTQISLSATFAQGTNASDAVRQATYTIALDGTVTVFDTFSFQDIVVSYSLGNSKQLAVSGTLSVTLFGSSFDFTGDIVSNGATQVVTADIAAAADIDLTSLFGGNFPHISFSDIAFNAYCPYGNNTNAAQFMVRGNCQFGDLQFTGLLYMQGTTPVLGSVVFTQSTSISTLFDQCIPGASWPSDLIDLTLLAGCQVYYNDTNGPLTLTLSNDGTAPTLLPVSSGANSGSGTGTANQGTASQVPGSPTTVTYATGFNLAASFVLTLLDDISIDGTVVVNGTGVTASIDIAEPIDIYVLSITQQGNPSAGPVLSFQTSGSTGSMSFNGALLFFQESFGVNATVTATRDTNQKLLITTTLTPAQDYAPLLSTNDSLTFSYSADQGFQIQNWPSVSTVEDIIDFLDTLKNLSSAKSSLCGALADFVCSDLLGQSWDLSLSFSSTAADGLSLNLTITYELTFSGTSFATVTLPDAMVISIPTSVSLDPSSSSYLWTVIVEAMQAAAESFVQALLNNPQAIAQFLVLFGGKQATQYAATLACQGLIDGATDAAVAAGADAAGAALGTAAVGVAAVGAAVLGVLSGLGGGGSGGGSSGGGNSSGGNSGSGGNSAPPAPTNLVATASGATVTATWWLSSGAQSYTATISDQAGNPLASSSTLSHDTTSYSFGVQPEALPATCTIAVTASNPNGTSQPATTTVTYLAAPAGLTSQAATATAPDVAMTVGWTAAANATSYAVTAAGPATVSQTSATTSAVLTFGPDDPAGSYSVTVTATGGAQTVQSPASNALTLTRLAAPTGLTSQAANAGAPNTGVQIGWAAVTDATSYAITASGPAIISQTSTTTSAVLAFGPSDPAGNYSVTVSATGGDQTIPSAPSTALTLTRLAAPGGLAASATATAITATWNTVTGAGSYALSWTSPDGTTGSETVAAAAGATQTGSITLPAPVTGGTWTISVQALPASGQSQTIAGPSSAAVSVAVTSSTISIQNSTSVPVIANGTQIAAGGSLTVDYAGTGVSIAVLGVGLIQVVEAGSENPGPNSSAVKIVSGNYYSYWGYDGTVTMSLTINAAQGQTTFSVANGPSQVAVQRSSPDNVFPIPSLRGDVVRDGVNLFTADVNRTFPLVTMEDGRLSLAVSAFYNSRSMVLSVPAQDNSLAGSGWKLLDYPKIAREGALYYFLDGNASHLLSPAPGGSGYVTGGQYHAWQFAYEGSTDAWTATDDQGIQYQLNNTGTLATGRAVWNLSSVTDSLWPVSTITVTYSGQTITAISNSLGKVATFNYDAQGRLASVVSAVKASGGAATSFAQVVLTYSAGTTPTLLQSIQEQNILANGIAVPVDAGYAFTYDPSNDPTYPFSLSSVQTPQGAVVTYTYDSTIGHLDGVAPFNNLRQVISVTHQNQDGTTTTKGFFYSFTDYCCDPTQTYLHYNSAKEYPGGIYAPSSSPAVLNDCGHTSYLFFVGSSNTTLVNYTGDSSIIGDDSLVGKTYWVGTFDTPVTQTLSLQSNPVTVGPWPGTLIPITLPSGGLACGATCTAAPAGGSSAAIALGIENNGKQLQSVYQPVNGQSATGSQTLALQLHALGTVTHVRVWTTQGTCSVSNVSVTYVVPPASPAVAAVTSAMQNQQVLLTANVDNVPAGTGTTLTFPSPYTNVWRVTVNYFGGGTAGGTLTATCFDENGNQIDTYSYPSAAGTALSLWLGLNPMATVAKVVLTSTGTVGITTAYLQYQLTGQPVTDDALCALLSSTSSTYQIGRPGPASFAKLTVDGTSLDGVQQSTSYTYGDDNTLPYPKTITRVVANPGQGGTGSATTTVQTQLTYACEAYPALVGNNVLDRVAQTVDYSLSAAGTPTALSGSVTQWQQWGTSWDEWRQFRLQAQTVSNGFAASPDASWLQVALVEQRNSRGKPLATVAADGTVTSSIYDAIYGDAEVATFFNADATAGEAGWIGFEAYESTASWSLTNGAVAGNQAFTGSASYGGTNATVAPTTFAPRAGVSYVVAAYVWLPSGATCTIGFAGANGAWAVQETVAQNPNAPGWVYVQEIMASPTAQQLPTVTVTSGYIDHVVFAPVDGDYKATVWDPSMRRVIATVGPNGGIARVDFGANGATLAAASPGKSLSLIDQSFSSVLGQTWMAGQAVYSSTMPNQELAVRTPDDGVWDSFNSLLGPVFSPAVLSNLTMTGNHLLSAAAAVSSNNPGTALAPQSPTSTDFVVCTEVVPGQTGAASGQSIGLTVRRSGTTNDLLLAVGNGAISLTDLATGIVLQSTPLQQTPPAMVLTLVVRQGVTLYAYANGAFLFSQVSGAPVGGPVGLRTTWPGSAFHGFGLVSTPELSNAVKDGNGTTTQFLASIDAGHCSVTQVLRGGDLMTYAGRTLATTVQQPTLAPIPDFATFDPADGTVTGSVTSAWPSAYSASPFADSIQRYDDPTQRIMSRGKGGIYAAGSQGSVGYSYGENADGNFGFANDELNTTTLTGPTGARIVTYRNRDGVLFGTAYNDPGTGTTLLTGYEHDDALRRTATYYPAAYATPTSVNKQSYNRLFTYDFLGNLTQVSDSDAGTTNFAYDQAGRQRLSQDAAGLAANSPYCVYTRYDGVGRVIETGTWSGEISQVTQAQLDDPTWPQQGNSWYSRCTWDTPNAGEANSIGRLTAVATPSFTQQYSYNVRGLPILIGSSGSFMQAQLSIGYDGIGRMTSLNDTASGYDVVYGYDEQGRMVSVGTSTNATAYATYTYGNGTVTETLMNGVATRVYTTNALGDLQQITDPYFSETLYFDTRKNGQPGYSNGQIAGASYAFTWTNAPAAYDEDYTYDGFGRLTVAANSVNPTGSIGTATSPVTYDGNGNILSMNRGGTAASFTYQQNCNRLQSCGADQAFTYDANGSVTASQTLGITAITYCPVSKRPLSATATETVQFTYDGQGRRVLRSAPGQSIAYLRDPMGRVLSEKIVTPQGTSQISYIHGLHGRIAMVCADGTTYTILTDHNRSARAVVDGNKQVVAWYNYDPYGTLISSISNPGTVGLRYLFCGQEWDADISLYEFSSQFYDPSICRFYSVDPLHQFASPYIYSNNPISFADLTGADPAGSDPTGADPAGERFGLDDLIDTTGGAVVGEGLELAREVTADEELSWKQTAMGAERPPGEWTAGHDSTVSAIRFKGMPVL
ncbi:RHS repeat-associated core domain-containing protein [Azospirillum rugosum]|uniref:RHS repeat-associated protein n=1 Tax=Azospirillum rugosum TaxID=416170 RepID=A0ABS4SR05_9PROT|nr:RHS repeat-associated core domain-containing protein [Azospirillum rugosum]MBP2294996.1 RHS repeat-associated protein [Azospirillum rugosum]MDQ0528819.1 RHS repeat-associated protein [Azospirillum rugosum]